MMSWIFGRQKSNLPEPTALQTQRVKQIEQLKSFNQNVSEIHRDVEYRVNFIVNGTTVSLYITLPPQFPSEKPVVKVSPPVRHAWVNEQMIVTGSPGINAFVVHSDLGKVIHQVVEEFQRNPPTLIPKPPYPGVPYPAAAPPTLPPSYPGYGTGMTSYMPMPTLPPVQSSSAPQGAPGAPQASQMAAPGAPSVGSSPGYPPAMQTTGAVGGYNPPEIPTSFPQLRDLSVQELQALADDEDKQFQTIMSMPQLSQIAQDREELCQKNQELAGENLTSKPVLEEKKRLLLEKYDLLNDLRQKFDEGAQRQDVLRKQFDPNTLQAKLKVAAMQAEEEAEQIAEKFLSGSISVEEFNKMYMERRKLSHLRKAKEEKLGQYIVHNRPGF